MDRISILLTDMPGDLPMEVANVVLSPAYQDRFRLLDQALAGAHAVQPSLEITHQTLTLLGEEERAQLTVVPGTIAVGICTPDAAPPLVEFLAGRGISFVLSTAFETAPEIEKLIRKSAVCGVLAPNLAVPTVLIDLILNEAAERYPGIFAGYQFGLLESFHGPLVDEAYSSRPQLSCFSRLGLPVKPTSIKQIRDADVQHRQLSVPSVHLTNHAYRFLEVASTNGDVRFEFGQRVHGVTVYAEGALTAAEFLVRCLQENQNGKLYTMRDVVAALPFSD